MEGMVTRRGLSRAERVEQIRPLLAAGMLQAEIARRVGVSRSYVSDLARDSSGEKARARKDRQTGRCMDCGGDTFNSGGRDRSSRCAACFRAAQSASKFWTRERMISQVREFHRVTGRPPRVTDASEAHARQSGVLGRRGNHGVRLPYPPVVYQVFGSWGGLIRAAGFDHQRGYERDDAWKARMSAERTVWTADGIIQAFQAWAAAHGRTPSSLDWKEGGEGRPAYLTVIREFGSWAAAVAAAGLPPNTRRKPRKGAKKMAGRYVVLVRTGEDSFKQVADIGAANAADALTLALSGNGDHPEGGEYTVVPAQWWRPRKVRATVKTVYEFATEDE